MNIQQVSVKLFAEPGHAIAQHEYIPIFHAWIRDQRIARDKLLIDVADYKHVHQGPGIMIIGHQAQWSMDEAGGELGLAYHRKRDPIGPAAAKLSEAIGDAAEAAVALEDEPDAAGRIQFDPRRFFVRVTSKLAAENDAANREHFAKTLRDFFGTVAPAATVSVVADEDPRNCLGATVHLDGGPNLRELHAAIVAANL